MRDIVSERVREYVSERECVVQCVLSMPLVVANLVCTHRVLCVQPNGNLGLGKGS